VPKHPFFRKVIDSLERYERKWKLGSPYLEVMLSTGPLFLSALWTEWLGCKEGKEEGGRVRVLMKDETGGFGFWQDFEGGSWHSWDAGMIFWAGDHWLFIAVLGIVLGVSGLWCLWWITRRLIYGRDRSTRYPCLELENSTTIEFSDIELAQ
jgi:mannosyltransferase OCH1-like enzyme